MNRVVSMIIGITLPLVFFSCQGLFIPDIADPRLPKFTEDGNGVAGAYIDDEVWESITYTSFTGGRGRYPYFYYYPDGDSLTINFSGVILGTGNGSSISFNLSNSGIDSFSDLVLLNHKKIALDGVNNYGKVRVNDFKGEGVGQIYFKVKQADSEFIFSGTFGFETSANFGTPSKVHYGRFDYSIDPATWVVIQ